MQNFCHVVNYGATQIVNTIELIQNTDDWHAWRKLGIGASEAAAVMGECPYQTSFGLWEEKLGLRAPKNSNYAMERGQRLEPAARAVYELYNSIEMPPLLVQHMKYPFIRASLDGANLNSKLILEIKCLGVKNFLLAKDRQFISRHHYIQMQHQLLVTGFERAHYFVYCEGEGVTIEVFPDFGLMEQLLNKLIWFWDCIQTRIPPPLVERDYKKVRARKAIKDVP